MLIVVGLVATVVVLLEREQSVARQRHAAATRAELTLSEREAYFAQLIESATDIITVLDEGATIVFESPAVTRVLGWDPQDLL
ncbi:MAG: PAS domain S-box protein, partial [Gemmatimonadetes bacterium]|nr:PAS domain S-box protein [Gemmatimonadota bacterium]